MSYQHPKLGAALGWKFNHTPGMTTTNGWLTGWPGVLGPQPTDADLAQAVAEYETYCNSMQCKDDELQQYLDSVGGKIAKVIALVLIDKGVCTMADLKAKYRSL